MPRRTPPEASTADPKDWICLAIVGAPKGVRGAMHLTCFNENPAEIASFNPLHAGPNGRPLDVCVIATPKPGQVVVRIDGTADRDAAAAMNGTRLYVPRSRMPDTAEDEFYHHDLIGLRVDHADGRELGTVKALFDHGAGDVIEILDTARRDSFLMPFTRENVPVVDLDGGRIVIDPPAGVLDDA
ncbi:MAG: 16S rRNA processing protein RimM [Rhodospirillales bacterium]|nr:16S rRNA processing protein RimM [Rhodospirillales bacterium]